MFSLLGLGSAAVTLPGTVELALVTAGALMPTQRPVPGGKLRRLAVVVPAHNEALGIGECIASLLAADKPQGELEIVVIADNCSDTTAKVAEEAGARVLERFSDTEKGKGYALEFAFDTLLEEHPDLDAILVVDADTEVERNFLTEAELFFAAGADAVQARYLVKNADASDRTRLMSLAFKAFTVLRPRGRSNLGLSCGISGNGWGLSRKCLEAVPYTARSVVEDLEHHLHLVQAGFKVQFMDETAVRAEFPEGDEGADTQRARWEGGRLRMVKEHVPALAKAVAGGDLRLAEPLLELLLMPLGTHVGALGVTLLIPFLPTQLYAASALGMVATHVGVAMLVGGVDAGDLRAIAQVPKYVLWKAGMAKQVVEAAQEDKEWVRTARVAEVRQG